MTEALIAYSSYVEVTRASATKLCAVYAREARCRNFVRLGAPEPADDGVLSVRRVRRRGATTYDGIYARESFAYVAISFFICPLSNFTS